MTFSAGWDIAGLSVGGGDVAGYGVYIAGLVAACCGFGSSWLVNIFIFFDRQFMALLFVVLFIEYTRVALACTLPPMWLVPTGVYLIKYLIGNLSYGPCSEPSRTVLFPDVLLIVVLIVEALWKRVAGRSIIFQGLAG